MAGRVGALRQPDADRIAAEVPAVVPRRDLHLPAHGLRHRLHQREEAVGRAAGDDLELAGVAVLAEGRHDVRAVDLAEDAPDVRELVQVEPGEIVQPGLLALRAVDLAAGQGDEPVEVALVAGDEQLVAHHRDERRGERHRQPVLDAVAQQPVEHPDDRDVGLGQRLEEPVLLEERRVLGMTDVGQMGVEDRTPVPDRHGRYRLKPSLAPGRLRLAPGPNVSLAPPFRLAAARPAPPAPPHPPASRQPTACP